MIPNTPMSSPLDRAFCLKNPIFLSPRDPAVSCTFGYDTLGYDAMDPIRIRSVASSSGTHGRVSQMSHRPVLPSGTIFDRISCTSESLMRSMMDKRGFGVNSSPLREIIRVRYRYGEDATG